MSKLPKIQIKLPKGYPIEDICDLEEAKYRLNFDGGIILVEGQLVHSYEELVQLASQEKYKNMEFIEVKLSPIITGG